MIFSLSKYIVVSSNKGILFVDDAYDQDVVPYTIYLLLIRSK